MTWSVCLSAFLDYNSEFSSVLVDHVPCMNRVVNGEGLRGISTIKRDVKGSKFPKESELKFLVFERHVIAVRFTYRSHTGITKRRQARLQIRQLIQRRQ